MNTHKKALTKTQLNIRELTITAMFIALTFVATAFINVRLPIAANGGLIHLGNVPLFIAAVLFGKRTGAITGAFGMALFDITAGWVLWAPFTFVIVGCIGYVFAKMTEENKTIPWLAFAVAIACVIKVVGYYIAEAIIYSNIYAPVASIPGNIVQIVVAGIIAIPIIITLRTVFKK